MAYNAPVSCDIVLLAPPTAGKPRAGRYPRYGLLPSLGLLYIAAALEEAGSQVSVLDAQAEGWDIPQSVREVLQRQPRIVGISVMSPFAAVASEVVQQLKAKNHQLRTVLGGPHPTVCPGQILQQCPELDAVIAGEGEVTMLKLVRYYCGGERPSHQDGVVFQGEDPADVIPGEITEIQDLPFPARRHLNLRHYAPEPYGTKQLPSTNLIASRGCTWSRCTYCIRAGGLKRSFRQQTVDRTLSEIDELVSRYGIRELVFYDEDLFAVPAWLHQLCDGLLKARYNLTWTCRGRADTVTAETLEHARDAGLFSIFFGFESGNQELLDSIEKGITLEDSRRAARLCSKFGIETVGAFMLALPGETLEQGDRTIEFAQSIGCSYASFQPTYPSSGTPLYHACLQAGWKVEDRYDERLHGAKFLPRITFVPRAYETREAVARKIRVAYRRFYLRPSFLFERLAAIRHPRDFIRLAHGLAFILGLV